MLILAMAAVCGAVANLVHPRRIAWVEDWGAYIEAQAFEQGLALVPQHQVSQLVEDGSHLIFDARPRIDYDNGHIPGAFSLPYDDLDQHFPEFAPILSPDQGIITYCSGLECDDALLLAAFLRNQGFTNVLLYAEGYEEWQTKGGTP
jgi:rhodanese-related sulfurtransferase